ncbi:2-dehydropantoate 2-reductase [Halobacillus dabanensis]|uniref:2-dehydropantoate 2-reductase n=1 Tax=Halobacillus dabanensis TaxID=240302 RepID=A0A1I3RS89_HALDA|nr:2-dehydropantoate 2-reductase [Halobacillus dabanensis]SFJ49178.1 2-dehydropantoate 2-reductase [Halobacillus dabanensis]
MKIGIAGAGAVGCYFGGKLYEAGHEVTFLARGEHLKAMSQQGLSIQEENRDFSVDGFFTNDVTALADVELVLFCVKSSDTKEMAEQLQAVLDEKALVMTMQNGVENEEILIDVFGAERILSAVTYIQASVDEPGKIRQQGRVKLVIGELDPSTDIKSGVVSLLQEADVDTVPSGNILAKKWNKLMWNATFNPLSALSGARVGEILDDDQLRQTAETICREVIDVAIHKGLPVDAEATISQIFSRAEIARQHRTSMLQDRLRGKRMEVEAMCGYITKQGALYGLNTPAMQSIYSALNFVNQQQGRAPQLKT